VGCRATRPAEEMLRFARSPAGAVALDVRAQLPGRGAWTCCQTSCIQSAAKKGGFARAFQAQVEVQAELLVSEVSQLLLSEALRTLGLAYRARQCTVGRMPALEWVRDGNALALVVANDLSDHSKKELAAVRDAKDMAPKTVSGPDKIQLGAALGRSPTGVIALGRGHLGKRLFQDLKRVANLAIWPEDPRGDFGSDSPHSRQR
jgi:predicted RNA-binding protein YlxR (DUF448 family)